MFQSSTLLDSLRQSWSSVVAVLPDLVLALILLIVGWLFARMLRRVAIRLLRAARVNQIAERAGIDDLGSGDHTSSRAGVRRACERIDGAARPREFRTQAIDRAARQAQTSRSPSRRVTVFADAIVSE